MIDTTKHTGDATDSAKPFPRNAIKAAGDAISYDRTQLYGDRHQAVVSELEKQFPDVYKLKLRRAAWKIVDAHQAAASEV